MIVGIYSTTLADIEKIQRWFYEAYGINISLKDAVTMSIHTVVDMSQGFVGNKIYSRMFWVCRHTRIDENASMKLKAAKDMISFYVDDIDLICNAIVSYRAMTLPRIIQGSAPTIKIKPDL